MKNIVKLAEMTKSILTRYKMDKHDGNTILFITGLIIEGVSDRIKR